MSYRRNFIIRLLRLRQAVSNIGRVRTLDYDKGNIQILADNITELETRAHSCAKEPETVAWIEQNAHLDTIFFDVGANIGSYSLVAAVNAMRVFSFEPAYQNFSRLNQNVSLNQFDDKISTFHIALSSETKIGSFTFLETDSGSSKGFYNEEGNFHLPTDSPKAKKDVFVVKLDDLIDLFGFPIPNLIKIDVDGGEKDVVLGADKILKERTLQSILIEIDERITNKEEILTLLKNKGFILTSEHRRNEFTKNYIFNR